MTGLGLRLYTDEDIDGLLAGDLRLHGYDAVSCHEAGNSNQRRSDDWQLDYATREGRAILVHNIDDYARLAQAWMAQDREHHGIIAAKKTTPYGELLRRVRVHLDTVDTRQQHNVMLFLR